MTPGELAVKIAARAEGASRLIVAIAGPPGSGKSTLADAVTDALTALGEHPALLPMDGFHLDNAILEKRGLFSRKGAPETFDFGGFLRAFSAIRAMESLVYVPVFDRELDLARAGAAEIELDHRIIVAEGNYLLLDSDPWANLDGLFDLTIYVDVASDELERRLIQRWLDHGHDRPAAETRARENDMVNAKLVKERSRGADIIIRE